jgi:predicted neuraminidase/lysophospholipase L1-like esterase
MPLGDSITHGSGAPTGYRGELYESLRNGGYDIDFVGSEAGNSKGLTDPDHEGHGGWKADQIRDNINSWLNAHPAEIVLLHIGTNDISRGQDADGIANEIGQILDNIDSWEKAKGEDVWVILARIVNRSDHTGSSGQETTSLNNKIQSLADARIAAGDKIIVVDMESALNYPADLDDKVHPNESGYGKMAAVWFNALNSFLPDYCSGGTTPTPTQTPTQTPKVDGPFEAEYVYMKGEEAYKSVHAADLLELEDGTLLVTFFGGAKEGASNVEAWVARKPPGGTWSTPTNATDDDETCFNPVLFQPRGSGDIMLFYKSPGIDDGNVATSSDGGLTWGNHQRLPDGLVGPIVNKPVQLDDGTIIAGSSTQGGGKRIHVERSTDNGQTWTKIPIDGSGHGVIQPTILVHSQTKLQLLMRTNDSSDNAKMPTCWSEDAGLTWSSVEDGPLPNNNSAVDAVTLNDGRHLLVYNHSTRNGEGTGRKGRGILTVSVSKDGLNWEAALVLDYRDHGNEQYSYPAVIQTRDGLVHVAYTWHRKRIKHVWFDPDTLVTYPIVDGKWPKDKIPWTESPEPPP